MKEERENLIQDNKIENNKKEKNEKEGRGLFYFVIAIAVIIIAIVGATYAFFTASTRSENSITTSSASLDLKLETDSSGSNYDLIPTDDVIAKYAYANQLTVTYDQTKCAVYKRDSEGQITSECETYKKAANSTCIDDEGQSVCSPFSFTVTNDNVNPQTLTMYLGVTTNEFQNLWYAVYTDVTTGTSEEQKTVRTRITEPKAVPVGNQAESPMEIRTDIDESETEKFKNLVHPTLDSTTPSKTFTIILWIKETSINQTSSDGYGKVFNGYVRVTSGDGDSGVTGRLTLATDDVVITSPTTSTTTPEPTSEATSTPGE